VKDSATATLDLFAATGAYLQGHFQLSSGLHSPAYLQCARVLQFPEHAAWLGSSLAARLAPHGPFDLVASPALGGLIIGHEVARALRAAHIFTERDGEGRMTLRRGFEVAPGQRIAVVEDVVTTGGSTREVIEVLRQAGAEVRAAGSIIDRSGGTAQVGVPRYALAELSLPTWPAAECPLCAEGRALVKPGSRKA